MIELCSEYLSVSCIWLYVLVMSRTRFRVNPHSIVVWTSRNFLLNPSAKSEAEVIATGHEPRTTQFFNEHSAIWPNWPNDRAVFWVLICTVYFTVCSCHVTSVFQSESTLYSCMNVKEFLARSRLEIWRWSDCYWSQTQKHLALKQTLNHLAKLARWSNCVLRTCLYNAFDWMFLSCHLRVSEWINTL